VTSEPEKRKRFPYRPQFAVHVIGVYDERRADPATGEPEEQRIDMLCEQCKATHVVFCKTGMVRQHVVNFARVHLHRDPFMSNVPPTA
jgi:hypothetical protein